MQSERPDHMTRLQTPLTQARLHAGRTSTIAEGIGLDAGCLNRPSEFGMVRRSETRRWIVRALRSLEGKVLTNPWKKRDNIPL